MSNRLFARAGLLAALLSTSPAVADENVMVVFDGSNSMWGQIEGRAKIEIARDVMQDLLGEWADDRSVGLMAYGHRRRGDCGDIELLVEPGKAARQSILDKINAITPTGRTPLTDAVEQAARTLSYTDQPATVVLISDGLESCDRDPCALAESLEQSGVAFTAHVVGFGLGADEDASSLACIAERTGGQFITAGNAEELRTALAAVGTAVAQAAPVAEPEVAPTPEPAAPEVTVQGPGQAVGGADIDVTWAPTVEEADYINVVPVGTDPEVFGKYVRIGKSEKVTLPVPGDEGLYEIRYLHNRTKTVLGTDALEVAAPVVELTAPDTVEAGANFVLGSNPAINRRDYVTIVPTGAEDGAFGNYITVANNTEGKLRAPADPGLYELRYVLNVDKRTVASIPVEVVGSQVTLQIPDTALTGADFDVNWAGTVNPQDYITIVPAGADEGEFGNYFVVRDHAKQALRAPADAGMYEVRYVLREGNKTLAVAPIEIATPEVAVTGPQSVVTGERFDVTWTGTVNAQDYITIVVADADEGEFGNYQVVRDSGSGTLTAPAEPGLYELRYVLREGSRTLASAPIEVMQPEVTVTAPETALAGSKFKVGWTGAVSAQDYINIVPAGADEGDFGNYFVVRDADSGELQAPAETGLYEIRYVLREGSRTIASAMVEIVEPEVTVTAPDMVRAGEKLRASWTGTVSSADYITLVPAGTEDDEFGDYAQVRDTAEHDFVAPAETGMYEVRYMLREGKRVLARQMVEVLAADAQMDTGASIDAPDTGAPGATIQIGWSTDSDGADQRITLARGNQADFTWISAQKIAGEPPMDLTLPDEAGVYEIRILDLSNKAVLSRKVITVE